MKYCKLRTACIYISLFFSSTEFGSFYVTIFLNGNLSECWSLGVQVGISWSSLITLFRLAIQPNKSPSNSLLTDLVETLKVCLYPALFVGMSLVRCGVGGGVEYRFDKIISKYIYREKDFLWIQPILCTIRGLKINFVSLMKIMSYLRWVDFSSLDFQFWESKSSFLEVSKKCHISGKLSLSITANQARASSCPWLWLDDHFNNGRACGARTGVSKAAGLNYTVFIGELLTVCNLFVTILFFCSIELVSRCALEMYKLCMDMLEARSVCKKPGSYDGAVGNSVDIN